MRTMKFMHLQLGQQFEFRGEYYTKVAPLIASNNSSGKQKMIPRSALVTLADDDKASTENTAAEQHPVLALLERYHQSALHELQGLENETARSAAIARLERLKAELATALSQQ